jgi:biotin operon repressor
MIYEQSQEIESRLARLLELIRTGSYSAPTLATTLNVSTPTVARGISALRRRGHPIAAVRDGSRWRYEMASEPSESPSHPGRP